MNKSDVVRPNMTVRTLIPFLALAFGLTWGLAALVILFTDQVVAIFGEIGLSNPLIILAVYSPGGSGTVWLRLLVNSRRRTRSPEALNNSSRANPAPTRLSMRSGALGCRSKRIGAAGAVRRSTSRTATPVGADATSA